MKYCEASFGRVFVLRLEQGDILHETIESFSKEKGIKSAIVQFVGGADDGSKVVVGPEYGKAAVPVPMVAKLHGASEALGVGTVFTNEDGEPILHMHSAFGRERDTITGCTRKGVVVWYVGEVVITELTNTTAHRMRDKATGFELLETGSN